MIRTQRSASTKRPTPPRRSARMRRTIARFNGFPFVSAAHTRIPRLSNFVRRRLPAGPGLHGDGHPRSVGGVIAVLRIPRLERVGARRAIRMDSGQSIGTHPPQVAPILRPMVEEDRDSGISTDVRQSLQVGPGLRFVVDGEDDRSLDDGVGDGDGMGPAVGAHRCEDCESRLRGEVLPLVDDGATSAPVEGSCRKPTSGSHR